MTSYAQTALQAQTKADAFRRPVAVLTNPLPAFSDDPFVTWFADNALADFPDRVITIVTPAT